MDDSIAKRFANRLEVALVVDVFRRPLRNRDDSRQFQLASFLKDLAARVDFDPRWTRDGHNHVFDRV